MDTLLIERKTVVMVRPALDVRVRYAVPLDATVVLKLMMAAHRVVGDLYPDPEPHAALAYIARQIARNLIGIVVEDETKKIAGFCLLDTFCFPWHPSQHYLSNPIIYVLPEYRKSEAGAKMVEFAKDVAKEHGIPVLFDVMSKERVQSKDRYFGVGGLDYVGGKFLWWPGRSGGGNG